MAGPSSEADRPVALVTGGASGIGRAIARALAAGGHRVVVLDREESVAEDGVVGRVVDVSDREALERVARDVEDTIGPVRVLVNNAGVFEKTPALDHDEARVRRVLSVNLEASMLCTAVFGRVMAERKAGRIVNVASIAAHAGAALASAYAASKAGLVAVTQSHARELAPHGIAVNAVLPGYCETPMLASEQALVRTFVVPRIPLRRVALPEEIAEVVAALVSLRTPYLTGAAIPIDGGLHVG